jgi:Transposase DDE domain
MEELVASEGLRFIVVDGSTVQEPGAQGTTYRLHIAIDLISLSLREVVVTTDKEGEHLGHYSVQKGDVVVIDRGYNQPSSLAPWIEAGGEVVLRYNAHGMCLHERQSGKKIDWETRLQELQQRPGPVPVALRRQDRTILGYVHAIPLPPDKADQARRKAKLRAQKNGRTASEKVLHLAQWVLIFTSLPPALLNTATAAALYRVRWQVELVIKRMKSVLNIDLLRARKGSQLAELYLHGKLLFAAVIEKLSQNRFAAAHRTLDAPRKVTDWRLWQLVRDETIMALTACFPAQMRFVSDTIKSLRERPRKRQLQQVPPAILKLIRPACDTNGKLNESET